MRIAVEIVVVLVQVDKQGSNAKSDSHSPVIINY